MDGRKGFYREPKQVCPISSFLLVTPASCHTSQGFLSPSSPPHASVLHTKYPKIKPFFPRTSSVNNTKEDEILQGACILQGVHFEVTNQGEQKVVGT